MTRKEFSAAYDAYRRQGARTSVAAFGVIFLIIIPAGLLSDCIHKRYGVGWTDNAMAIFMLVTWIGAAVGVVLLDGRLVRRLGLVCPLCHRPLGDRESRAKVLLTGNCPKCGNKVLDEEPTNAVATAFGLDREEFQAKLEIFSRQTNRQFIKLLLIGVGAITASVPITKYFQRLVDRGALDWVTLTQWRWFAALALGVVCLLALGIFFFAFRGKFDLHPLPCPECGRSLVGMAGKMAVERGMCIYCGSTLFKIPPSNDCPCLPKVKSPG